MLDRVREGKGGRDSSRGKDEVRALCHCYSIHPVGARTISMTAARAQLRIDVQSHLSNLTAVK